MSDERQGVLQEDQRVWLQEAASHYIDEANDIMEEFFGTSENIDLIEVCCPQDSRLVETFIKHGRKALRIGLPAIDMSKKKGKDELIAMIKKLKPRVVWFSLPCGPYSPIQELFNEDTPEKKKRSEERKSRSRRMISHGLEAADAQLRQGGDIAWEWPRDNRGWRLPRVERFFEQMKRSGFLHEARLDGCAYGLCDEHGVPIRKPWKVKTSSLTLSMALPRLCPGHPDHRECLGGDVARKSGFYPQALCDVIQKGCARNGKHI